jgi:hypothetical protein
VPARLANLLSEAARVRALDPPVPTPVLQETMYWTAVADADPAHAWLRRMIAHVAGAISEGSGQP